MKITFFSNYVNHHQIPFCKEMKKLIGNDFKFVATTKVPEERIKLGYKDLNNEYDFVVRAYEDEEKAYKLGDESDIVIIGSAPMKYIKKRLHHNKIIIRYNERIFKGFRKTIRCVPLIATLKLYNSENTYLLCASAYAAKDFNKLGLYRNKTYKWGYFPEIKEYKNIEDLINKKKSNSIIWVGRFIDWKHPEIVVKLAKKLKNGGYRFNITMIGTGNMYNEIERLIKKQNLQDCIELLGPMPPEKVRKYMEESRIFIFTSNKTEGWGAVLNEAMNSACSIIANKEIGSVPFLINNEKNGLIYEKSNIDELYNKVKILLDNKELAEKYGIEAYKTMINTWNPRVAAQRVIELSNTLLENKEFIKYNDGPCSMCD